MQAQHEASTVDGDCTNAGHTLLALCTTNEIYTENGGCTSGQRVSYKADRAPPTPCWSRREEAIPGLELTLRLLIIFNQMSPGKTPPTSKRRRVILRPF
jgi:hypothetical protein